MKVLEKYGLIGTGRTMRDARNDWERKAEAALTAPFEIEVIKYYSVAAIVHRDLESWWYEILDLTGRHRNEPNGTMKLGCSGGGSRDETVRAARRHLAQWVWRPRSVWGFDLLENEEDFRQHMSWCRWQNCCRAWIEAGEENAEKIRDLANLDVWPEGVELWEPPEYGFWKKDQTVEEKND